MRTLEIQFQLTKAEWEESRRAFLSPDQQIHQEQISRFFKRLVTAGFVLAGLCLIAFPLVSPALASVARLTAPPYVLMLALYLVGPFLLNKYRTGGVITYFAFMDQGWRHFTSREPKLGDFVRPWEDLAEWTETKYSFQVGYRKPAQKGGSTPGKFWSFLNAPVSGLGSRDLDLQHAIMPKRALTKAQIQEIRSLLTATVPQTGWTED